MRPPVNWTPRQRRAVWAVIALLIFSAPHAVRAEEDAAAPEALVSPDQTAKALADELPGHRADLEDLKQQLQRLKELQETLGDEIKANESQDTAHSQLLLMRQPRTEDLERAIEDNRLAARGLSERSAALQKSLDEAAAALQKSTERIELSRKQLDDLRQSQLSAELKKKIETATKELLELVRKKKQLLEQYLEVNRNLLGQVKTALTAKEAIGEKLALQLQSLQKDAFFQRRDLLRDLSGEALLKDLRVFRERLSAMFSAGTWSVLWKRIKAGGPTSWLFILAALGAIIAFRGRYRSFLRRLENRLETPEGRYRRLCLLLLRRSTVYIVLALLFGLYRSMHLSILDIDLGRLLFYVILVLLVSRCGLDYARHGFRGPPTGLRAFVTRHFVRFVRFFRFAVIVVLALLWIAGRDSLTAWMARTVMSAGFLLWAVVFWRRIKPVMVEAAHQGQSVPGEKRIALVRGLTYLVFGGTLLLNFAGYTILAGQWFRACTESVVLLFWGWLGLKALREWHQHRTFLAAGAAAKGDSPGSTRYLRRSLIQLAGAIWLTALAAGMLWVWDPSGFVRSRLGFFFDLTVKVGSLNLSVKGILLAVVIIFFTHLILRIGRALLKERILDGRPLERGLKDSILTIASYLGWALGLVLALGVLGVNTTSLAVIFGALSIGIGFGLQNIFNNFISGLILLFERPIQVGDYVEIGGLWAEVKKINVRSTVVQTFDNASVIIPNSEFISQQVTNWSFKDKRMRRNLEVGVAYGSDVELVQKTLLEIAHETRGVLHFPEPNVIFVDHADSALIFRLRIWVDVDDYWTVASQIRFDIDRRFRELGIEIAFPQRDLHIRSLPAEKAPEAGAES